jgi:hypothetical protein
MVALWAGDGSTVKQAVFGKHAKGSSCGDGMLADAGVVQPLRLLRVACHVQQSHAQHDMLRS